jgi:hypothetical protein
MPTFAREMPDREERFQVLQDGARVYASMSSRGLGDKKWATKERYPRFYVCKDPRDAKAFCKELIGKLPKRYKLVGEKAPELEAFRNKLTAELDRSRARRERAMKSWEAKHHAVAELKKQGRVYWTSSDEFWEITLRGKTITVSTGPIGEGRTETFTARDRADALVKAQRRMMSAMGVLKFGPAKPVDIRPSRR